MKTETSEFPLSSRECNCDQALRYRRAMKKAVQALRPTGSAGRLIALELLERALRADGEPSADKLKVDGCMNVGWMFTKGNGHE